MRPDWSSAESADSRKSAAFSVAAIKKIFRRSAVYVLLIISKIIFILTSVLMPGSKIFCSNMYFLQQSKTWARGKTRRQIFT